MAGQIGSEFCLVVDLVPHHSVRLARGAGRADGEDEASVPGHDQQLQHLDKQKRNNTSILNTILLTERG